MPKRTVIIGGVAGGATTAARLRRLDEKMEIILLERGEYISYANCGLPYYIGNVIENRDALLLQTPQAMKDKFQIDVRILNEAIAINRQKKTVSVKKLDTGEVYELNYDILVLATGSSPLKPPISGIDGKNIFTLWSVKDTDAIKNFIQTKKPKTAAVIGGGFIGLEIAENLCHTEIKTTIIEMQNQVMTPIDYEMAKVLEENIEQNGVELLLKDGVDSFEATQEGTIITLKSGKKKIVDFVLLCIGVSPNSQLAERAGLLVSDKKAVVVDKKMVTSDPDIYAVGDVVEVENFVLQSKTMIPLAAPANKQARICADNIAGAQKEYQATQGTSVAKVFDLTVATVGVNEKTLLSLGKVQGIDYESIVITQKSHAGYYPKATPIFLKLLFEKTGRILGAQIIGQQGVDKRIDTIAVTMRLQGSAHDLAKLELAYAPPYSSAKDPVNMLGFVAENVLNGLVQFIKIEQLDQLLSEKLKNTTILDVTEPMERMVFSIPDSISIPLGQLRQRFHELDKENEIIVYCAVGVRSYNAARILMQNGFEHVKVLEGGTAFYQAYHYTKNLKKVPEHTEIKEAELSNDTAVVSINCCGLQCPGPIMKVYEQLSQMEKGEVLKVSATDMGFIRDIQSWCGRTGNTLLKTQHKEYENIAYIKKGTSQVNEKEKGTLKEGKTMVVFSGDLDKALAAFIIANGAAAMGRPVTMFFTFWGLNILRRPEKKRIKKSMTEKMFAAMMPRGSKKLKLSKMNMAGMGSTMMKRVMKKKNVDSLEHLIKQAQKHGVKLVACTMSMDIMGIKKEELIKGVDFAGVAHYLSDAEQSDVNLFI